MSLRKQWNSAEYLFGTYMVCIKINFNSGFIKIHTNSND